MKSPFTHKEVDTETIQVETLFGTQTKRGLVGILWGDKAAMLTPKQAREHALIILEAAAVAEQDELYVNYLQSHPNVDVDSAVKFLQDLRKFRERLRDENE